MIHSKVQKYLEFPMKKALQRKILKTCKTTICKKKNVWALYFRPKKVRSKIKGYSHIDSGFNESNPLRCKRILEIFSPLKTSETQRNLNNLRKLHWRQPKKHRQILMKKCHKSNFNLKTFLLTNDFDKPEEK